MSYGENSAPPHTAYLPIIPLDSLTQLDHLQVIFGIIAIIFVVKSCVSIAEL
jgi:hypothetical protein